MPKYSVPVGDPIDCLGEECSEVIKEIFKMRRFGPQGTPEWLVLHPDNRPPRENVIQECGDVVATIQRLIRNGWMTQAELDAAVARKHKKLEEYFGVST